MRRLHTAGAERSSEMNAHINSNVLKAEGNSKEANKKIDVIRKTTT